MTGVPLAGVPLVSCVPNISEGRDRGLIESFAASVSSVPLLDVSSDPDHNRTVLTFAGHPEAVLSGALTLAEAVFESLNLQRHGGVHPRIGVLDVLPFVPVAGVSLSDCAALAHRAAQEIWRRWRVPSFFYEAAGLHPLEDVRRLAKAGAPPDTGTGRHSTAGAVAIGSRRFLIAWNVWLESDRLEVARSIASRIRASGGGFAAVKALGLPLASRGLVQVSINSTDFEAAPLHVVFQAVLRLARDAGVRVRGSELIGLIPQRAIDLSFGNDLHWMNWRPDMIFEQRYSRASASHSCT